MKDLIDNLDDFRASVRSCLALYSGGLDSSWFLDWARCHGVRVVALHVHLGAGVAAAEVGERAARLGAEYRELRLTETFAEHFIAPAIQAGAMYQGAYPVCSSLSRPLMAEAAVKLAREEGLDCVVHTTTFVQNSAARFNNSVRALAPELAIANPLIREAIRREEKRLRLAELGVAVREGVYSIDENIWGRVVECGELDDPGHVVPTHIWKLTAGPAHAPRAFVTLGFEGGTPASLDGEAMPLADIISRLNMAAGTYGVGRFNGLEDTPLGLKNHEVREAPAAAVILSAHAALERAILTQRELRVKAAADLEWTELVTNGLWHSPLREALGALVGSLSRLVSGEVVLELTQGNAFVSAVRAPHALHFWNVAEAVEPLFAGFSYRDYFEVTSLPLRLRSRHWLPSRSPSRAALDEPETVTRPA